MTSQEPENSYSAGLDIPDTEVISVAAPAPVFVDSTGRRSRLLRRLAYAFGALVMLYGGLISVSLAGGPVQAGAVLPLPGLDRQKGDDRPPQRPNPAPAPTPSHGPTPQILTGAMPGRPTRPRLESTRISVKPAVRSSPTKKANAKPKPAASTSRPVESTTTPPTSTPPTTPPVTTPGTTPANPPPMPPPLPPAPPGTGGQGGGESTVDDPAEVPGVATSSKAAATDAVAESAAAAAETAAEEPAADGTPSTGMSA